MKRKLLVFLFLLNFSFVNSQSGLTNDTETIILPQISSFVNDFENVFDIQQFNSLNTYLETTKTNKKLGIIIVTTSKFEPYKNIFDYSLAIANRSRLGSVYIVFSKDLQVIQIQNSEDIRKKLTDEETKFIIDNYIIPEFVKGDYYSGLIKGINKIKKELK